MEDARVEMRCAMTAFVPTRERQGHGHAHDEDEPREHQIGKRATGPVRVQQRWKDRAPVARIVHEDHRGDGGATEDVQRLDVVCRDSHRCRDRDRQARGRHVPMLRDRSAPLV